MTVRLIITSAENGDDNYVFDHETIAGVVGACMNEFIDMPTLDMPREVADLLETIAAAIRQHDKGEPPIAKHWDFSSPESAFYVLFFEDSEDDAGEPAHVIWERARAKDAGLDAAVRAVINGDQDEVIQAVAPAGWDSIEA